MRNECILGSSSVYQLKITAVKTDIWYVFTFYNLKYFFQFSAAFELRLLALVSGYHPDSVHMKSLSNLVRGRVACMLHSATQISSKNLPIHVGHLHPNLTHHSLGLPDPPPQTASRSSLPFCTIHGHFPLDRPNRAMQCKKYTVNHLTAKFSYNRPQMTRMANGTQYLQSIIFGIHHNTQHFVSNVESNIVVMHFP